MIRRSTWFTLAVFVLTLAGAIWWSRSGSDDVAEATPTPATLWELAAADVAAIEIIDLADDNRVRAHRQPEGGWQLDQPPAELADGGRLERAVTSLLIVLPAGRQPATERGQYGLAAPRYRIRLELVDGSSRTLELGREAPTGAVWYGQLSAEGDVLQIRLAVVQDALDLLVTPPIAAPTATSTPSAEAEATTTPG